MSFWDQFKSAADEESAFIKFDNIGDRAEGVITKIGTVTFGSDTVPNLTLKTKEGHERILTVSGANLLRQLVEMGPDIGDHIEVVFTETKKTNQPSPMKIYKVVITPAALQADGSIKTADSPETVAAVADPF